MRKLIVAAAAVAAIAIVPAEAMGASDGTERPFKGRTDGAFLGPDLPAVVEGTYQATHIGKGTYFSDNADIEIVGADFLYSADLVITAANGDELYNSSSGSGTRSPGCFGPGECFATLTVTETITGGTGRFEGASGSAVQEVYAVPGSDGAWLATSRVEGSISYRAERPFKGSTSGTFPPSQPGIVEGTFRATHIGKGSYFSDNVSVTESGPDLLYSGDLVITAANGDELYATGTGTGTRSPGCFGPGECFATLTINDTITGGTGRFEGASGSYVSEVYAVPNAAGGWITTSQIDGSLGY